MMPKTVRVEMDAELLDEIMTGRGDMDTRSEVVMILPRPGGEALLISKPFYPEGTFRLPSGGIHPGESPEDAFTREAFEETGLHVQGVEMIAEITHQCTDGARSAEIASYVIAGPPTSDPPHPTDPHEQISAYREADSGELRQIAGRLRHLEGRWAGWGRFRASPHEAAADYLAKLHNPSHESVEEPH